MKVIILAAGIGSRLGKPHPKALTLLSNGRTIMQNQIRALLRYVDIDDISIVVGFKKELIMEAHPELCFIYNDYFDTTNTSKSLLRALKKVKSEDVIWINGDVVFEHVILERLISLDKSCMAVNTASVGDEEVKYTVNADGHIREVSKVVEQPIGEAVGINKLVKKDIELVTRMLEKVNDQDYFEKGIELAIKEGMQVVPIDVSDVFCTEIDFEDDLLRANNQLGK